jgi:hypothetical protein
VQIPLRGLAPGCDYRLGARIAPAGRGGARADDRRRFFRTAPAPGDTAAVRFVGTTGHRFDTRDAPA